MNNIEFIDWDEFNLIAFDLLNTVKLCTKPEEYDGVIAILRGGMYVGDSISRKLSLPLYYIEIASYNESNQQKNLVEGISSNIKEGKYYLCDDIYDTGRTINYIINKYPNVDFTPVTLISKIKKIENLIYHSYAEKDNWIYFPWER